MLDHWRGESFLDSSVKSSRFADGLGTVCAHGTGSGWARPGGRDSPRPGHRPLGLCGADESVHRQPPTLSCRTGSRSHRSSKLVDLVATLWTEQSVPLVRSARNKPARPARGTRGYRDRAGCNRANPQLKLVSWQAAGYPDHTNVAGHGDELRCRTTNLRGPSAGHRVAHWRVPRSLPLVLDPRLHAQRRGTGVASAELHRALR